MIYSQVLLLSGNFFCFDLKFCRVIKTWNEKSLVNSQKDKIFFTDFKLFSLFWRYDTCICYNKMFPIIFNIYNIFIISSKFKINKTLFDFCEIDYTLFSILYQVPECSKYLETSPLEWKLVILWGTYFKRLKLIFNNSSHSNHINDPSRRIFS